MTQEEMNEDEIGIIKKPVKKRMGRPSVYPVGMVPKRFGSTVPPDWIDTYHNFVSIVKLDVINKDNVDFINYCKFVEGIDDITKVEQGSISIHLRWLVAKFVSDNLWKLNNVPKGK